MPNPGLNQRAAHHAIHQAAFREAERLTLLLRRALRPGDQRQALQVAGVLVEHWQTQTLRHAEAEETGWYRDILIARPGLQPVIAALTRDHELMRLLLAEAQGILSARGMVSGVVERFEAMLLLNGIHSREEERLLLDGGSGADETGAAMATQSVSRSDVPLTVTTDAASLDPAIHHEALASPVPLAVARPSLHAQLGELLRQRGLSLVDLVAEVREDTAGQAILHVAYGPAYAQSLEQPLDASATADATEAILRQVVAACELAAMAAYQARMRTPT